MCPDDVDPSTPEFLPRLTKEDNTFVLHFYLYNPRTGIEEWVAKGTWRDGVSANYVNYRHFQVENVDAYRNGNKSTIVCNGRIIKMGQYGGKESVFEGGGRPAKSDFDFGG
jgi:hypothetical protein